MIRTLLAKTALAVAACLCIAARVFAQAPAAQPPASLETVAAQMQELRQAVDALREQLAGSRRESEELRRELQVVRDQLTSMQHRADTDAEDHQLLNAKVEDQEQTKVESGSKYHVRLSGMALLNAVSTRGPVDDLEVPLIAAPRAPGDSGGAFAAGVRQSFVDLELFGPALGGAKSSAGLTFDFFGGFPLSHEGVTSALVRLRTATFTLDWKNASIVTGQDAPFFSPRSPTSLTSTAYPALSSAGNLWAWTPQVHVEHRLAVSDTSTVLVQWGILDPLTGELPAREYRRTPTAGERSRVPAQALRVGWQRGAPSQGDVRVAAFGAGAYHATQNWGFGRTVHAWAATADWDLPLGRRFALSGELYRGHAIAGLGAGASDSVVFDGAPALAGTPVRAVDSAGGWSQLKFTPLTRLEFNAVFGGDHPYRAGLVRLLPIASADQSPVNRNVSGFLNGIYRARSNLLFSVEYRRLWTTALDDVRRTADHLSFSAGIVF